MSRTMSRRGTPEMLAMMKSRSPYGGVIKPDHDVDDDHDAEMHEVDAERLRGRNEDRNEDQEDGRSLQHAAEQQQEDVDEEQESRTATAPSRQECAFSVSGMFSTVTT